MSGFAVSYFLGNSGYSVLEISHCLFSHHNKRVIYGGSNNELVVDSCLFEENTDMCIYTGQAKTKVSNSIFRKNTGTYTIYAQNGEFRGNFITDNYGVGLRVYSAIRVEIVNNLITNNGGGGIYIYESDPVIANNTICNNQATNGGGIVVRQTSSPLLISNIIWNNNALNFGDQIYIESFSKTDIRNSILEGGLGSIGYGAGSSYKGEYISNIEENPAFINAPTEFGDGYTSEIADWVLADTSPCINMGLVTEGYSLPETDLRKIPRISHGFIDIGALEYHREKIEAGGIIDSNATWIADTVKVFDNVEITADNILSIAAGTIVEFQGPYTLECEGGIRALGKIKDSIVFTARNTATGWKGIDYTIYGEGNDTSVFRYVRISHIVDSTRDGIFIRNIPYIEISNSVFKNNVAQDLLYFQTTKADINYCSFINNRGPRSSVVLSIYSDLSLDHCLFYNNTSTESYSRLIYQSRGNLYISNSYFINNDLLEVGYCILKGLGNELSISNTVIANNHFYRAIYASTVSNTIKISNSTITGNMSNNGNYIYADGNNEDSKFIMTNTILQNNSPGTDSIGDVISIADVDSEILNNNIQGGLDSIRSYRDNRSIIYQDNIDTLPVFLNPTAGIGPKFDALEADWGLSIFSPCLDKGIDYDDLPLAEYDILGNPRLVGNGPDLGAVENQSEALAIKVQPDNRFLCEGETALFTVEANDSALYQWKKDGIPIENADSATLVLDSIQYSDQGNYKCIITNGFGSVSSNSAYLLVKLPPKILTEIKDLYSTPGEDILLKPAFSGSEPISYAWKKDGLPIPGELFPELFFTPADSSDEGMYSFELSNSCGTASTKPVSVFLAPQLCMVTVSATTGHNLVVWEKKSNAPILAYNIYRESEAAGIYDLLVSMPSDELSVYVDTTADPTVQAYLYKITAIDTSHTETDIDLCKPHKTIHLIVSTNPELNTTQLQWDRYFGFDYQTYTIYKSTTGMNFDPVHSLSASLNSWTDPEASSGDLFYRIAVEKPDPCVPEGSGKKAGTGPYQHALSNMDDNKLKTGQLPPDTITISNNSILEESLPGTMIGKLLTEDPDTADSHIYQFISGEGDDDNISFTLMGDLLLASESFDFETKNQYSIRIRSTDKEGGYCEVPFVIQILTATGLQDMDAGAVKAYPNPFSQATTIIFPNPAGEAYKIILSDLSGKVYRVVDDITTSDYVLERGDLKLGFYFIEMRGSKIYRGKIVIE
ncbi:right-handed parallel beta-helix repeat-containing protein [Bacteroidota bacterium]